MAMKQSDGYWRTDPQLHIDCPYCDAVIDEDDVSIPEAEPFHGKLKCPECGKTFIVDVELL